MHTFISIKGNINISLLLIFILSATINAKLDYEFPHEVPTDLEQSVQVSVSDTNPDVDLSNITADYSQISFTLNGLTYCLTDPNTTLQPRTNKSAQNFAALEECEEGNPYQLWQTRKGGELITRTLKRNADTLEPSFPYYAVNYTHFASKSVANKATGRCILGDSSYPGLQINIDYKLLPNRQDFYGFVYVSDFCPTGEEKVPSPTYSVRTALVGSGYDFKGEDANPRWAYPDIKEVVYLDGPTISEGRTWHCPKLPKQDNETGTTPDPSEAEYRTRTLIIPYLVQLTINNTNFFPALFGCANNTDASFPSFSPSPIEAALNEYGKKVEEIRICKNDVVQKVNTWSKDQEDYEELDHCYSIGKFYKWFKSCQPFITPEGTLKELLPVGDKPLDDCDDKAKWVLK